MGDHTEHAAPEPGARELALLAAQKRMYAEMPGRRRRNLEVIKREDPALYELLAALPAPPLSSFFCLENGEPDLVRAGQLFYRQPSPLESARAQLAEDLSGNSVTQVRFEAEPDNWGSIHHRYNRELITRLLLPLPQKRPTPAALGSLPVAAVFGVGLGYGLKALYDLREKLPVARVLALEPDRELLNASLNVLDWQALWERAAATGSRLKVLCGPFAPGELAERLYDYFQQEGNFLASCWWAHVHYVSPEIRSAVTEVRRDLRLSFAALGYFDDHLHALSHACAHALSGVPFVRRGRKLPAKAQVPVFIVGGGPSLDKDLSFLRRHQDRALIFACGTTIDPLYHAGVQPDFYCCTERISYIAEQVAALPERSFVERMTLLSSDVVHPQVRRQFRRSLLFVKPDEPFAALAAACLPDAGDLRPIYLMNPLVGNLGLSAALHLGMRELLLFGFDSGSRVKGRMHSQYTRFYSEDRRRETGGQFELGEQRPGNFGGVCETGYFFMLSMRYMEQLLAAWRGQADCINCSDGCLIEGARPCRSAELEERFAALPVIEDKKALTDAIINELAAPLEADAASFREAFRTAEFTALCARLKALLEEAVKEAEEAEKEPVKDRAQGLEVMLRVQRELNACSGTPQSYLAMMLSGSLNSFFISVLGVLYRDRDEPACLRGMREAFKIIGFFLEDAARLYPYLPDYCFGDHLKLNGGRVGFDHGALKAPQHPGIPRLLPEGSHTYSEGFTKRYE